MLIKILITGNIFEVIMMTVIEHISESISFRIMVQLCRTIFGCEELKKLHDTLSRLA